MHICITGISGVTRFLYYKDGIALYDIFKHIAVMKQLTKTKEI